MPDPHVSGSQWMYVEDELWVLGPAGTLLWGWGPREFADPHLREATPERIALWVALQLES